MKKLPDVILASDGIYEKQALREAEILNVRSYAVFNTNGDIDLAHNMIPANTNSVKSFDYIASELKSAFLKVSVAQKATVKKVEEKKVAPAKKATPKVEEKVEEKKEEVKVAKETTKKPRAKKETSAE